MQEKTNWIWVPEWTSEDDADARIVCFRKEFIIDTLPDTLSVRISADSRYKLFVNGVFIQEGPSKGDLEQWFVDSTELVPYVKTGQNVIACEVLRYPVQAHLRNHSLYRTEWPCLFIENYTRGTSSVPDLNGSSGWKCLRASHIRIVGETGFPAPIHVMEHASGTLSLQDWKCPGYDDSSWDEARPYSFHEISPADAPFHLIPREIPPMRHQEKAFRNIVCVRDNTPAEAQEAWNRLLSGSGTVSVPPHTRQVVEISAGTLQCGYPRASFIGGKDTRITFIPAESYVYPVPAEQMVMDGIPPMPKKGDRTDYQNGCLLGQQDVYTIGGFGTREHPEEYEPFWFRTFRFVRLEIETREEPLIFCGLSYRATGYPFDLKTRIRTSDPSFDSIWDISLRTLKRCMHETYMDCPYYEQLQYTMDSRSEILFTYCTTADDRLARQCMDDFRRSQRSDGMLNASAPTVKTNVIPGFSIYYILMLHDHMMYFGDRELIRDHFPAVERVLRFFEKHLTVKGLVGPVGGPLFRSRYWSFIDWTPEWNETAGVPTACLQGDRSLTMESLLYLYGLQTAAELAGYIGRNDTAREYLAQASDLTDAIRNHCMGLFSSGLTQPVQLLQDGPGINEYSVHCQVFGILTGVISPEEGRHVLEAVIGNPHAAQSSVSFMFYLYRALEKTNWYEKTDDLWNLWRKMVSDHMTTCVENTTDGRSDCHAWASVLLYELPAVYLGVRPAAPGYREISVAPIPGHLTHAEGTVITPRGEVFVSWFTDSEGKLQLQYRLPE